MASGSDFPGPVPGLPSSPPAPPAFSPAPGAPVPAAAEPQPQAPSRDEVLSRFALSTRWNAERHVSGEALVEEIRALGFSRIEIGYDLRTELIPGVQAAIREGVVRCDSVHNFCPVPVGVTRPSPEIYTMGAPSREERALAVKHTARTLRFAAEVGARTVVCHAGNVDMPRFTYELIRLVQAGRQYTDEYERLKLKAQLARDKRGERQADDLAASLEQILPVCQETGVHLALEILPTWEALPSEMEGERLAKRFAGSGLRLWWDIGHGQIRDNLGLINSYRWLQRWLPYVDGFHIHDVLFPGDDHQAPGPKTKGSVDFAGLKSLVTAPPPAINGPDAPPRILTFEPSPHVPADRLAPALPFVAGIWFP